MARNTSRNWSNTVEHMWLIVTKSDHGQKHMQKLFKSRSWTHVINCDQLWPWPETHAQTIQKAVDYLTNHWTNVTNCDHGQKHMQKRFKSSSSAVLETVTNCDHGCRNWSKTVCDQMLTNCGHGQKHLQKLTTNTLCPNGTSDQIVTMAINACRNCSTVSGQMWLVIMAQKHAKVGPGHVTKCDGLWLCAKHMTVQSHDQQARSANESDLHGVQAYKASNGHDQFNVPLKSHMQPGHLRATWCTKFQAWMSKHKAAIWLRPGPWRGIWFQPLWGQMAQEDRRPLHQWQLLQRHLPMLAWWPLSGKSANITWVKESMTKMEA